MRENIKEYFEEMAGRCGRLNYRHMKEYLKLHGGYKINMSDYCYITSENPEELRLNNFVTFKHIIRCDVYAHYGIEEVTINPNYVTSIEKYEAST